MSESTPGENINKGRRDFMKGIGALAGAAALANVPVDVAEAQEAKIETQESKVPSADEMEGIARATISKLQQQGQEILWVPSTFLSGLEREVFGNQDPYVAIEAFKRGGLDERTQDANMDYFRPANNGYAKFSGDCRRLFNAIENSLKVERRMPNVDTRTHFSIAEHAENLHASALALARANDQLLAKIGELKRK